MQSRPLLGEGTVRGPNLEDGVDGEEGCSALVREFLDLLPGHADGVGQEFASDGEVRWLWTEEIVHDGPRSYRPTIVDLHVRASAQRSAVAQCIKQD